jgi:hypothetical protein
MLYDLIEFLYASVILEPYCFCDAHELVFVYFHFVVVIYLVMCSMRDLS